MLSLTGAPLPVATIDIESAGPTDVFSIPERRVIRDDGEFAIPFQEPGIYRLTVRGVFHKSVSIPIMLYDQESIDMTIQLVPYSYNSGNHFDKEAYVNWIRAYGNFNDYDFFSGEIFKTNSDGSVSAFIKTDLDTIRYQIRGLANGSSVLPDADYYDIRGRGFEAVIINTSDRDSVELRFHPDENRPYNLTFPDGLRSWQSPMSAFITFQNPTDKFWVRPLSRVRSARMTYETRTGSEPVTPDDPMIQDAFYSSYDWRSTSLMSAYRDSVVKNIRQLNLQNQQRSALLISYVGLLDQELDRNGYLERMGQTPDQPVADEWVINTILSSVDPRHPVWALNDDAPLRFLEAGEYRDDVVRYAEQMVKQHPDGMVVRNLALALIEKKAQEFETVNEMPYYGWIVDRYGENNLARRAKYTFRRASGK